MRLPLLALLLILPGCAALDKLTAPDPPATQPSELDERLKYNDARVAELEATIPTLPADSPQRKVMESELVQRKAIQKVAPYAQAATSGSIDSPAWDALSGLPYGIGGVAASALAFLRIVKKERAARAEKERQLAQVVNSVDAAFPRPTPEQELKLRAFQDSDTQKAVMEVKADASLVRPKSDNP